MRRSIAALLVRLFPTGPSPFLLDPIVDPPVLGDVGVVQGRVPVARGEVQASQGGRVGRCASGSVSGARGKMMQAMDWPTGHNWVNANG